MANTSKNKNDRPATLPDGLALPQEQEIEKAILSGLMASHRHMPTLAAQLLPEMFTLPQVAMAFEAYLNIYNRGESADALSVEKELRRIAPDKETLATDLYQLALGGRYLETSDEYMPTHARHLREAYVARQFMLSCYDSALKASRPDRDTEALLKEMDSHVGRLMERLSHATNSVGMKEATLLAKERMLEIQRRVTEGRTAGHTYRPGGLDRMTGGMMPGTLNVIAARPRVGQDGLRPLHGAERGEERAPGLPLQPRDVEGAAGVQAAGCIADIEPSKILKGTLSAPEMKRIQRASDELERLPIWIDERTDLSVADLRYQISLRRKQGAVRDGDRGLPPTDALAFRGPQEHERPDIGHHTATKADRQGERHPRHAAEPAEPELRGETHAEEHAVRPGVTPAPSKQDADTGILPPPASP